MKRLLSLTVFLLCFVWNAQSFAEDRIDGYTLHQDCNLALKMYRMSPAQRVEMTEDEAAQALQCIEYVTGIVDGITINNIFYAILHDDVPAAELVDHHALCVPAIGVKQAVKIVNAFMNKHSQYLSKPRFMIVGRALYEAFPPAKNCTAKFYELARQE